MSRWAACMRCVCLHTRALALSRTRHRHCATTPSVDEVRAAYKVLGVAASSSYADVKRRYVELAKQHHPDVAAAASDRGNHGDGGHGGSSDHMHDNNRMVDINNAYSTVRSFHKSGQALPRDHAATAMHGGDGDSAAEREWARYAAAAGARASAYTPWHEDVDAMMYEMMWEEMRRHGGGSSSNSSAGGAFAVGGDDNDAMYATMDDTDAAYMYAYYPHENSSNHGGSYRRARYAASRRGDGCVGAGQSHRRARGAQRTCHDSAAAAATAAQHMSDSEQAAPGNGDNGGNKNNTSGDKEAATTNVWCNADVQAMLNMYEDGKSFDFIANALGKDTADVVRAFNRWSRQQQQQRPRPSRVRPRRHYEHARGRGMGGAFYYAESPDDVPFELYAAARDDATHYGAVDDMDPYGYCVYDNVYCGDVDGDSDDGGDDDDDDDDAAGGAASRVTRAMPYNGRHYMHRNRHVNNNNNSQKSKSAQQHRYRNSRYTSTHGGGYVQNKTRHVRSAAYHKQRGK